MVAPHRQKCLPRALFFPCERESISSSDVLERFGLALRGGLALLINPSRRNVFSRTQLKVNMSAAWFPPFNVLLFFFLVSCFKGVLGIIS